MPERPRNERMQYTLAERNDYAIRVASEKAYCRKRGLIPVENYAWSCACAHLLLRQDCPPGVADRGCVPDNAVERWYDHISVYTRIADGRNVLVSQPYCPPTDYARTEQFVKAFCAKWKLNYMISNEWSFYRPGRSLLIELSPPLPQSDFKVEKP